MLVPIEQNIQQMQIYIQDIQSRFQKGSIKVETYTKESITPITGSALSDFTLQKSLNERRLFNNILSNITVSSEYESMNQLFMLNSQSSPNSITNMNKPFSPSGLGNAESKYVVMPINNTINKEQSFEKSIEDGFGADGVGNAKAFIKNNNENNISSMGLSASVVDTEKMEDSLDSVNQKVLFGEINVTAPYSIDSITESFLYGQHVGLKTEAEISKSSFSGDVSPLSGDVFLGQAEAKANYENYTVSGAAGVAAVKVELKLEPLNFFGYEPLEEWFVFDYDPFIGIDFSLGSIGVGASVGLENSIYAAYGVGIGVKAGMEEDK